MVRVMEAASQAARKAIEGTYGGVLSVTELQKIKAHLQRNAGSVPNASGDYS